jgi:acetate kinase
MNTILTLNIGSTSIKYSIYNDLQLEIKGKTENIIDIIEQFKPNYIVVRVVFGGVKFLKPIFLNPKVIQELRQYDKNAPLHNPKTLDTVEQIMQKYTLPILAVFDSSFHSTIAEDRYRYGISKDLEYKKYGFHGLSCQFITNAYTKLKKTKKYKIIICHLGGGASVTAVKNGKSLATSMGYGPEEGLIMVKRCGDIGANVVLSMIESGLKTSEVRELLYTNSGIKGLTGSEDIKSIFESDKKENQLVLDIFLNKVLDYIGSYHLLLQGIDDIILTGGIGENSAIFKEKLDLKIKVLGIKSIIIPTNEELIMVESLAILIN